MVDARKSRLNRGTFIITRVRADNLGIGDTLVRELILVFQLLAIFFTNFGFAAGGTHHADPKSVTWRASSAINRCPATIDEIHFESDKHDKLAKRLRLLITNNMKVKTLLRRGEIDARASRDGAPISRVIEFVCHDRLIACHAD